MAITGPLTNALTGQLTSALTGVRSFAQPFLTSVGNFVFLRSGDQTFEDFEGLVKTVPTDQPAHVGARMVENLFVSPTDLTDAAWSYAGGASNVGNVVTFPASSGASVRQSALTFNAGDVIDISFTFDSSDIGKQVRVGYFNGSTTIYSSNLIIGTGGRVGATLTLGGTAPQTPRLANSTAAQAQSVTVINSQTEIVTGQANQNPSEFVDGVKFFGDTNANVVDSNGVVSAASLLRNLSFDSARDTTQGLMESLGYNIDEDHVIVANDSTNSLWIYDRTTIDTDAEIQLITRAAFSEFAFPGNPTEGNKYVQELEITAYNQNDGHLYVMNNHNTGTDEAGIFKLLWGGGSYSFVDFVPLPSYLTFNPQCLTILPDGTFLVGDADSSLGSLDIVEYTPNFTTGGSYSSVVATFSFTGTGYGLSNNGVDVVCVSYEGAGTDAGTTARQISKIDWPSKVQYVTYLIQDTGEVLIKPRAIEYINRDLWIGENPTTFISDSITIYDEFATALPTKGVLQEGEAENIFRDSFNPATQTRTVTAVEHTLTIKGTGSITLSGTGSGVSTEASPLTFTPTAGGLIMTLSGTVEIAQLEIGAFGTSFIETPSGSSATRNATSLTSTWDFPANNFSGQIKVRPQFDSTDPKPSFPRILYLSNGTSEEADIFYDNLDGKIFIAKRLGGTFIQIPSADAGYSRGDELNIRFKYDSDGFHLWVNALAKVSQTSGIAPDDWTNTLIDVEIGNDLAGHPESEQIVEFLKIWNEAKSDEFLSGLT